MSDEREQFDDALTDCPPWCFGECCGGGSGGEAREEFEPANVDLTVQYVVEQLRLITVTVKKANRTPMATNDRRQPTGGGGNRAGQQQTRKPSDGIARLEVSELSNKRKIAFEIEWAGDPAKVGPAYDWMRVSVKLRSINKGVKRMYTVGDNNPVCDVLYAGLGSDWSQWTRRTVLAWKAIVQPNEKQYIRLQVVEAGKTVTDDMLAVSEVEASGEDIQETNSGGVNEDIPF